MAAQSVEVEPDIQPQEERKTRRRTRTAPDAKPKRAPRYAVILHNDSVNGFDFVIRCLRKIFHYSNARAFLLTSRAHFSGRSAVWSGSREVAELKADQLRSCGGDPVMATRGAKPLRVSIEPIPGTGD